MIYQRNIMGISIYHNMSVSQSCLFFFLCNPNNYFLSNFINFLFTCLLSFFFEIQFTYISQFSYLVTYVLANALYILTYVLANALYILLHRVEGRGACTSRDGKLKALHKEAEIDTDNQLFTMHMKCIYTLVLLSFERIKSTL